jgi:outer membrane protein assembly factor BamD
MRKYFFIFLILCMAALASCASTDEGRFTDPAEAFEKGNEEFDDGFYEESRRFFQEARRVDTTGDYAPLAQLRIGDSFVKSGEPELAAEEFRRFLDEHPRHKYASYAQYQIGMIYYGMIKGPERGYGAAVQALDAFTTLNERYPRNPYRETVKSYIQRARDVIAGHEFLVADYYFKRDACHGTVERLTTILESFPDYRELDEVFYRLAVCKMILGNDEDAREYLEMLGQQFPDSKLIRKTEERFREIMEEKANGAQEKE